MDKSKNMGWESNAYASDVVEAAKQMPKDDLNPTRLVPCEDEANVVTRYRSGEMWTLDPRKVTP